MKKRIFSVFLALVMALSLLPTIALATEPESHTHCICGGACEEIGGHTHDAVPPTWTAWNGDTDIDFSAGTVYIYLSKDVTKDITVPSGKTLNLCLNGHVLKGNGNGSVITVRENATLNLCDCNTTTEHKFTVGKDGLWVWDEVNGTKTVTGGVITGGNNDNQGGAILVSGNPSKVEMYGGSIVGNYAYDGGGVVIAAADAEFTMYSGSIAGNKADYGGGIYGVGTVTMSGGSITENIGGGVYVQNTMNLSGNITIKDNKDKTNTSAQNIIVAQFNWCKICIVAPLSNAEKIGVGTAAEPTKETPQKFAEGVESHTDISADLEKFSSDDNRFAVTYNNEDKCGYLSISHTHEWTYSIDRNKITAQCKATQCVISENPTIALTQSASEKEYDGTPFAGITMTPSPAWTASGLTAKLYYVSKDGTSYPRSETAPTEAGEYFASMEIGDKEATTTFSIKPHAHCVCGKENCHAHGAAESYTKLTNAGGELPSGNYVLTDDVTLNEPIIVNNGETINLCLNGHVLEGNGTSNVITVYKGGTLNICDCHANTQHKFEPNAFGLWVLDKENGSETVNGGVITGGRGETGSEEQNKLGGAIYSEGDITMYGGNLVGNMTKSDGGSSNHSYGGAVYLADFGEDHKFEMIGGTMQGNVAYSTAGAQTQGGAIYVGVGATFTIGKDAVLSDNAAKSTNDNANLNGNALGGGVYMSKSDDDNNNATVKNYGRIINNIVNSGNGVAIGGGVHARSEFYNYGEITGNKAIAGAMAAGGGVSAYEGKVYFGGAAKVIGNNCTAAYSGDGHGDNINVSRFNPCEVAVDTKTPLKSGANIGINYVDMSSYAYDIGKAVSSGITAANAGFFTSDVNMIFTEVKNGELWLSVSTLSVSGNVTKKAGGVAAPVSGATVTLKGENYYDTTQTDGNGDYCFTRVPAGVYRAVVTTTGNQTMTVLVTVENQDVTNADFVLAKENVSSVVEVKPDTPEVIVGGLSAVAENQIINSGDALTVKLVVEKKDEEGVDLAKANAIREKSGANKELDFLDMSVIKQVNSDPEEPVEDTTTVLEIAVPFSSAGRNNIMVYRYHGTEAKSFTPLPARPTGSYTDGTFFVDSDYVYIYTRLFSTYAIGYDEGSNPSHTGGGSGGSVSSYSITIPTNLTSGKLAVDKTKASAGSTVTITVSPDKGYTLETLSVLDKNGKEIALTEKDGKYSFKMPSDNVEITATFMDDNTMLNFFVDVPANAYYYDAVLWAAKNGITGGTDTTHFSPNWDTTRAQMVTFLWRANGCPEPKSSTCAFTDVAANAYYYKAVLWAAENGYTEGTSATTFSPDVTVTRAQAVTFLWRISGKLRQSDANPFADVAQSQYYHDAVLWAADNGITDGTSATAFSPDNGCTRAQIVTFLYRYFVK